MSPVGGIRMREIADEREATRWMEGEKARSQVDVVFGIGTSSVPEAAWIGGGGINKVLDAIGLDLHHICLTSVQHFVASLCCSLGMYNVV